MKSQKHWRISRRWKIKCQPVNLITFRTSVSHFQDGWFWSNICHSGVFAVLRCEYSNQQEVQRRRQYWVKPWIRMRIVCWAYHSLYQQLLTTDSQSFPNFTKMDVVAFEDMLSCVEGVADLSINDLIGWNHRNLGRFIGVNEHCSFMSVIRPRFCSSGILPVGIFGQWDLTFIHWTPAVSTLRR